MTRRVAAVVVAAGLLATLPGELRGAPPVFLRIVGAGETRVGLNAAASAFWWTNGVPDTAYRVETASSLAANARWYPVDVYHATGSVVTVDGVSPDPALRTALVPGGTFQMGDALGDGYASEQPVHPVTLSPFYVDRFEVTWAHWVSVRSWATNNGYAFDGAGNAVDAVYPVVAVSWHDCVKWCNARSEVEGREPVYYTSAAQTGVYRTGRLNLAPGDVRWSATGWRLPTEAEWECAARGGAVGRRFPWSDTNTISHARANYRSRASDAFDMSGAAGFHPLFASNASPVGAFAPNAYGLYDVAGNAWEWCWDWYDPAYYGSSPAENPRGPAGGADRVARGDSYYNHAFYARCAYRNYWAPTNRFEDFGLRCVRRAP